MAGKECLRTLRETGFSGVDPRVVTGKGVSMSLNRLKEFLDSNGVKYEIITHQVAYTAQGIAALTHISGKELAKTVIVKVDGELAMAVLPASGRVDLAMMKEALAARSVELASEQEFRESFPDCETGAMPPFGNLYGLNVFADTSLSRDEEIVFNAGSHRELVRLSWYDFTTLVQPRMLRLAAGGGLATAA